MDDLNRGDKSKRKKLKLISDKYNLDQLIEDLTRISKMSETQRNLIFSNKPERKTKSYSLITGLSDHNLALVSRKLTKNRTDYLT